MGFTDFFDDFGDVWDDLSGPLEFVGNILGGRQQQRASQSMAREQMAWQERMSNTAHQREVADLRAAGLNPLLSARLGGASSPTGSMGTAVNFIGDAASRGISTALQSRRLGEEIENMDQQNELIRTQRGNIYEDTLLKDQERKKKYQETENEKTIGSILRHNETSAKAAATADSQREGALEDHPWARRIGSIIREILPLGSALNSAKSLSR